MCMWQRFVLFIYLNLQIDQNMLWVLKHSRMKDIFSELYQTDIKLKKKISDDRFEVRVLSFN